MAETFIDLAKKLQSSTLGGITTNMQKDQAAGGIYPGLNTPTTPVTGTNQNLINQPYANVPDPYSIFGSVGNQGTSSAAKSPGIITSATAKNTAQTVNKGLTNLGNTAAASKPLIAPAQTNTQVNQPAATTPQKTVTGTAQQPNGTITYYSDGTSSYTQSGAQGLNPNSLQAPAQQTPVNDYDKYLKSTASSFVQNAINQYEQQNGPLSGQELDMFISQKQQEEQTNNTNRINQADETAQEAQIKAQYANSIAQEQTRQKQANAMDTTSMANMGVYAPVLQQHQQQQLDAGAQIVTSMENERDQLMQQAKMALDAKQITAANDLFTQAQQKQQAAFSARQNLESTKQGMLKSQQDQLTADRNNRYMPVGNSLLDTTTGQYLTDPTAIAQAKASMAKIEPNIQKIGSGKDEYGNPVDKYGYFDQTTGKLVETNQGGNATGGSGGGASGGSQGGNQSGGGQTDSNSMYSDFTSGLSSEGAAAFSNLNEIDKGNVQQLIDGDALASDLAKGMGGAKYAQTLLSMAKRVNPTYSETVNKQRYQYKTQFNNPNGKDQQSIGAINTALGHLAELAQSFQAINNSSNLKGYNSISNMIKKETSNPDVTNYDYTLNQLASEIASAYKGGVPDKAEIDRNYDVLSKNLSVKSGKQVMTRAATLLASKISTLSSQYKAVMGKYPDAETILQNFPLQQLKDQGIDTSAIEKVIQKQSNSNVSSSGGSSSGGATGDDIYNF